MGENSLFYLLNQKKIKNKKIPLSLPRSFNLPNLIIWDILNEVKFRVFYSLAIICILSCFIYLNLGFYVEFLWSYYLDYYQFIDFNWSEGIEEQGGVFEKVEGKKINVEIDEFKELFISILSSFSGQLRWAFDLSAANKNAELNIFFLYLFYPLSFILSYHIFCFITPGVLNSFRPRLFGNLQKIILAFSLNLLILPHLVSISEEFAYESVDSELFPQPLLIL